MGDLRDYDIDCTCFLPLSRAELVAAWYNIIIERTSSKILAYEVARTTVLHF